MKVNSVPYGVPSGYVFSVHDDVGYVHQCACCGAVAHFYCLICGRCHSNGGKSCGCNCVKVTLSLSPAVQDMKGTAK